VTLEVPPERTEVVGAAVTSVMAENPGPLTLDGTRTWIVGIERLAIIDPGPADPAHLERVDRALHGRDVVAVCLTHSHVDHAEAASEAARRWAPVHASAETLSRLGLDGVSLPDCAELTLGAAPHGGDGDLRVRALATPGHSGDHLAYMILPDRDLLTGDLVLGRGSSMVAHPDGSVGSYLASLARMAALRPARLLPGHGPVVSDALTKLSEYATHRRERTEQVRAAIEGGAADISELLAAVYGELPPGVHHAAELSLRAHLEHLAESGYESPLTSGGSTDRK
jgi:glyoxylase-like metal-dependent hydrolase (beta-lactamase superfamily II)